MSISPEYFNYIDHFHSTVPLREFVVSESSDLIALRHDVDYSIDVALEMAFWEHEHGIRATYFLLHTANYWQDPRLIEKCLQLQAFGHEVGLHLNLLTEWFESGRDPGKALAEILDILRGGGVDISGVSAHGDKACYEQGFINHWLFRDLRPEDPEKQESGRNAEGMSRSSFDKQILYPASHVLRRKEEDEYSLWQLELANFDLDYMASHCRYDRYFTDSGGAWIRSDDPLQHRLEKGRHQILMHPLYWRGPQRKIFVLSTARSGSLWISQLLEAGSSTTAFHERTLNHFPDNEALSERKMTGGRLQELLGDTALVESALDATEHMTNSVDTDYVEANAYLPMVLDRLQARFPDATYLHLYRNPKDVVRSIMNRGWYDTPDDTAHPAFPVEGWESMTPFEKCCVYVAETNRLLLKACGTRLQFEKMTSDYSYLSAVLKSCGIATHPLLAAGIFGQKVNVSRLTDFPDYVAWSYEQKATYNARCSQIASQLGYGRSINKYVRQLFRLASTPSRVASGLIGRRRSSKIVATYDNPEKFRRHLTLLGLTSVSDIKAPLVLQVQPEWRGHAHTLFNGGEWNKLARNYGWDFENSVYYSVELNCQIAGSSSPSLFCLMYDDKGILFHRRLLGRLSGGAFNASFAAMGRAARFNIALYVAKHDSVQEIRLFSFCLRRNGYER